MTRFSLALSAALLAAPGLALAGEPSHSYPRLTGDATSQHVEYAPGAAGNVVGGGVPVFTGVDDGRPVFAYGAPRVQATPRGTVPRLVNVNGESRTLYGANTRG